METLFVVILLLNIPFGYWRATVPRFSRGWALAIHIPVPVVIALRLASGIPWRPGPLAILVGAFALGQFLGGRLHALLEKHPRFHPTACLVWDIVNAFRSPAGAAGA